MNTRKIYFIVIYVDNTTKEANYLTIRKEDKRYFLSKKNSYFGSSYSRDELEEFVIRELYENDLGEITDVHSIVRFEKIHDISTEEDLFIEIEISSKTNINIEGHVWSKFKRSNSNFSSEVRIYWNYLSLYESRSNEKPNPNLLRFITKLNKAQRNDKLVIFLGAGISANYGYPMWGQLLERISEEFGVEKNGDYLKYAQLFFNKVKKHDYYSFLREVFHEQNQKVSNHDIVGKCFDLEPSSFITTNYDSLIEKSPSNSMYEVVSSDKDLNKCNTSKLIIKMHGDFTSDNIVFTEDDYLNYSNSHTLIENYITSLISSRTLLLLGFSYDDINLKYIVQKVRAIHKADFNRVCIFFPNALSKIQIDYLEAKGLDVFCYEEKSNEYSGILKMLKRYNSEKDYKSNDDKEGKISNFLELLKYVNTEELSFDYTDPVDHLVSIFKRYSQLPSLSPYQLGKRLPVGSMRSSETAQFYPGNLTLKVHENRFVRRLKEIDIESKTINDVNGNSTALTASMKNKWNLIFETFNKMSVFYLSPHNTHSNKYNIRTYLPDMDRNPLLQALLSGKTLDVVERIRTMQMAKEVTKTNANEINECMAASVYIGDLVCAGFFARDLSKYYVAKKDYYNHARIAFIAKDFKYLIRHEYKSNISEEKRYELFDFLDSLDYQKIIHTSGLDQFEIDCFKDIFEDRKSSRIKRNIKEAYCNSPLKIKT